MTEFRTERPEVTVSSSDNVFAPQRPTLTAKGREEEEELKNRRKRRFSRGGEGIKDATLIPVGLLDICFGAFQSLIAKTDKNILTLSEEAKRTTFLV